DADVVGAFLRDGTDAERIQTAANRCAAVGSERQFLEARTRDAAELRIVEIDLAVRCVDIVVPVAAEQLAAHASQDLIDLVRIVLETRSKLAHTFTHADGRR